MTTVEQRPQSLWTAWQPLGPDSKWTMGPPLETFYPTSRPSRPWWWSPPYAGFGEAGDPSLSTGQKVGVAIGAVLLIAAVGVSIAMSG